MKVQLLSETNAPDEFIRDPAWCAQEKLNGDRMLIEKRGNVVRAFNRRGVARAIPGATLALALSSDGDWLIDGELIGDIFTAFDLIVDGEMVARLERLGEISPFPIVRVAFSAQAKRDLLESIENERGEGVVFKKLDEPYRDGRDVNAVKFKFWNSESFVVRSVDIARGSVGLLDQGRACGRCCFPMNAQWPRVGDRVEVQFSRRTRDGQLLHPVWCGAARDHQAFS